MADSSLLRQPAKNASPWDTYLRLHENRWATAEEVFITPEMWDPCVNQAHHPTIISRDPLYIGIDVGIKHDNAARVAVKWDESGEKLILVSIVFGSQHPVSPWISKTPLKTICES